MDLLLSTIEIFFFPFFWKIEIHKKNHLNSKMIANLESALDSVNYFAGLCINKTN